MEIVYLSPSEALHALADGKVLENDAGINLFLDESLILQQYKMGKNNTLVTQNFNGSYDGFFIPPEIIEEEPDAP